MDGAKRGRGRRKRGGKICPDGNLEFFELTSDWPAVAQIPSAYGVMEAGADIVFMETLHRKRIWPWSTKFTGEQRRARPKPLQRRPKEEEATAPTAIDEAEEKAVANQYCTVQGAGGPWSLTVRTGRVLIGRGDNDGTGDGASATPVDNS